MTGSLFSLSLVLALASLIKAVLDRRAPGTMPLQTLLRERFSAFPPRLSICLLGLLAGSASVLVPYLFFASQGWVDSRLAAELAASFLILAALTFLIKILWAALEEVIFRGALLPQLARWSPAWFGIILSALLFAFGHLEGRNASPNGFSLVVYALDGVGFGLIFLAARGLWPAVIWHASKNIWIWLLYSESTLQFAPGIFRTRVAGPELLVGSAGQAGLVDVLVTAIIVLFTAIVLWGSLRSNTRWLKEQ